MTKNRKSDIGCLLDKVNKKVVGKKILKVPRSDINKKGRVIKKNNLINNYL